MVSLISTLIQPPKLQIPTQTIVSKAISGLLHKLNVYRFFGIFLHVFFGTVLLTLLQTSLGTCLHFFFGMSSQSFIIWAIFSQCSLGTYKWWDSEISMENCFYGLWSALWSEGWLPRSDLSGLNSPTRRTFNSAPLMAHGKLPRVLWSIFVCILSHTAAPAAPGTLPHI